MTKQQGSLIPLRMPSKTKLGAKLVVILKEFQSTHLKAVNQHFNGVRKEFTRTIDGGSTASVDTDINSVNVTPSANARTSHTFMYDGKFHAVPKDFQFPKLKLREAVRFWLCGQSMSENGQQHVKPFKNLNDSTLPTKDLKKF